MLLLFIPLLGTLALPSPRKNSTRFEDQNLHQRADDGKCSYFIIIDTFTKVIVFCFSMTIKCSYV